MKCDQCDNEATVHEVTVREGEKVERHLCEQCAVQVGIASESSQNPIEILKMIVEPPGTRQAKAAACPTCGLTFEDFRTGGLLGCANCYESFEARLLPLIERAHEGGLQHTGKIPTRLCGQAETSKRRVLAALIEERAHRAATIRKQLEDAVKSEQYERAAQLRDALQKLTQEQAAGDE
ncbi:MAG: UvrB/UvrC motif-containing protein [Planctomycetota bacterium]